MDVANLGTCPGLKVRDLNLTTLRYFVAVCEAGNVTRAAEREHLVASAVSKRLAQLEVDLGVSLLQRRRQGVVPTPAGEVLLAQSRTLLATADRIAQEVASFGTGVKGQVTLLATVSCVAEMLPDDIAEFMRRSEHRQIQIDIEEHLSRDIVRRIKEGSASLGVLWDGSNLEGLEKLPYRMDHLAVVVPSRHPLAARKRCAFVDTLEFEHVGLQASAAVNIMMSRAAAMVGKQVRFRTQVSSFDAAMRVVKAQLGVSILPWEIALPNTRRLGLKAVPLQDEWAKRRFVVCYSDHATLSKAATMLLDFLVTAARRSR